MKKVLISAVVISALWLSSCDKSDEKSKTDLLCGKNWKVTAATVEPGFPIRDANGKITGYTKDMYSQMSACERDDVQKYNADKTYVSDTRTKCDADEDQKITGTWSFNSSETAITEVEDGISTTFQVLELSDNKLKIKYTQEIGEITFSVEATMIPE